MGRKGAGSRRLSESLLNKEIWLCLALLCCILWETVLLVAAMRPEGDEAWKGEWALAIGVIADTVRTEIQGAPTDMKGSAYDDSFLSERNYGGERKHYGTDLMDLADTPGRLPIYSMTKGVVTNLGWNELGGWRVGVTSPSGVYYYYAHLHSYAPGLEIGDTVQPGRLLGYMGDSGYGEEGTTGRFPTHLHLGIQVYPEAGDESWINPYPFLMERESK